MSLKWVAAFSCNSSVSVSDGLMSSLSKYCLITMCPWKVQFFNQCKCFSLTLHWHHAGHLAVVVFWRFVQLISTLIGIFFVACLYGSLSFCEPRPMKALKLRMNLMRLLEVSKVPEKWKILIVTFFCLLWSFMCTRHNFGKILSN